MAEWEIFFNLFVCLAFLSSVADHWFVGRGYIVVPLRCFLLGCFLFTELYLAVTAQPAMWLYVGLNLWGLLNIYIGRHTRMQRRGTPLSPDVVEVTGCSDEL